MRTPITLFFFLIFNFSTFGIGKSQRVHPSGPSNIFPSEVSHSQQCVNDILYMLLTLFPEEKKMEALWESLSQSKNFRKDKGKLTIKNLIQNENIKRKFLRHLFLMLAYFEVTVWSENNARGEKLDIDMPLASFLSRGQRVLFDLNNISTADFFESLVDDASDLKRVIFSRKAASHGIDKHKDELFERKRSLIGSLRGAYVAHKGINIAYGGLGEACMRLPEDLKKQCDDCWVVGPGGVPFNTLTKRFDKAYQRGHMYIFRKNFSKRRAGILIGIERTAFGKKSVDLKSAKHTLLSGSIDQSRKPSVSGSDKWSALPYGPAPYGAVRVTITKEGLDNFKKKAKKFFSLNLQQQRYHLTKILALSPTEAHAYLEKNG